MKLNLGYARLLPPADDTVVIELQQRMRVLAEQLVADCQGAGVIDPHTDVEWVLRVLYALVHEASIVDQSLSSEAALDAKSSLVIETLLSGVGA